MSSLFLFFWMILTFIFTFLKKIKKRRSLYIFILYILIFYSFAWKKRLCLYGFTEFNPYKKLFIPIQKTVYTHTKNCLYPYKKLFIPIQKTVYTHTKNCLYPYKKLDIVWVFLYNKSIEKFTRKSLFSMPPINTKRSVFICLV